MSEVTVSWSENGGIGGIEGSAPILIIGANGSGKTRLGIWISQQNENATRIPAYRQIATPENIQLESEERVSQNIINIRTRQTNQPWTIGSDINPLMQKLCVQDSSVSSEWAQLSRKTPEGEKVERAPKTVASRVCDLWDKVFPGRRIVFGMSPKVVCSRTGSEIRYSASMMSDGERAAFYLACAVFNAPSGLLIIDEPDTFLHPKLLCILWDELEAARQDCRFVYITHDLTFARSRRNARYIVAKSDGNHELLAEGDRIPLEVVDSVLGALTLDINTKVLIVCEGVEGGPDEVLLSRWFSGAGQKILPVGTSIHVSQVVEVLRKDHLFKGGKIFGVVDRDEKSDEDIKKLEDAGILTINVNEIESIYCVEGVFSAVAGHLLKDVKEVKKEFRKLIKKKITPVVVNKYALQRTKHICRSKLSALLDSIKPNEDKKVTGTALKEALKSEQIRFSPTEIFDCEIVKIENAVSGEWAELVVCQKS